MRKGDAASFKCPEWTELEDALVRARFRQGRRDSEIAAELCGVGRKRTEKAVQTRRKALDLRRSTYKGMQSAEDTEQIWWKKAKVADEKFQAALLRHHPELQGTVSGPSTERPRAIARPYTDRSGDRWNHPPSP